MSIPGNLIGNGAPRADWSQENSLAADYIKNKPEVEAIRTTANAALPKTGGAMTGSIQMGGNRVTGLGAPQEDGDAAGKGYVDGKITALQVTLAADGWEDSRQQVAAEAVTEGCHAVISPDPESMEVWVEQGILCLEQAAGMLEFSCLGVPAVDVKVNVLVLK